MTMKFAVILHEAEEGGYWAEVPSLPGCVSQGETVEEALENIKDAIELFWECMLEDGEEVRTEPEEVRTVTVELPAVLTR